MEYEVEYFRALCSTKEFIINGIEADHSDFISLYDHSPQTACAYGCGDMRADILPPSNRVLEKYKITKTEYFTLAHDLASNLSFGSCGWCV